jgi:hypothetical protein
VHGCGTSASSNELVIDSELLKENNQLRAEVERLKAEKLLVALILHGAIRALGEK